MVRNRPINLLMWVGCYFVVSTAFVTPFRLLGPRGLRSGGRDFVERDESTINQEKNPLPKDDAISPTKSRVDHEDKFRQRGMSLALASTYFSIMGAKCVLPSVLSLLTHPTTGLDFPVASSPQASMAKTLGLSTLAVALGKALLGPGIDRLGGIRSLQLCLALLASLLTTIAGTQQFQIFCTCWILVDFIFSSGWAGCINAIHQSFPPDEWSRQVGRLAAGARSGNAVAFAVFASLLYRLQDRVRQPWRVLFGIAAAFQLIPLSLLMYFGRKPKNKALNDEDPALLNTTDVGSSTTVRPLQVLRKELKKPEFWLHLISRSSLMVFASFLLFVPLLMSTVYGCSDGLAAQTGSVYSLGCLLAVTLGSKQYASLTSKGQRRAVAGLLGGATAASIAQFAHVHGWISLPLWASIASLFCWGVTFSIPFYVPPSVYALARGGAAAAATLVDVLDMVGFAGLALFNGYVAHGMASISSGAQNLVWKGTFGITTGCAMLAWMALPRAMFLQERRDNLQTRETSNSER